MTDAVVDGALRVHSVEGLRVVDASIMPKVGHGEHELTRRLMIGEKAADIIAGRPPLAALYVPVYEPKSRVSGGAGRRTAPRDGVTERDGNRDRSTGARP